MGQRRAAKTWIRGPGQKRGLLDHHAGVADMADPESIALIIAAYLVQSSAGTSLILA